MFMIIGLSGTAFAEDGKNGFHNNEDIDTFLNTENLRYIDIDFTLYTGWNLVSLSTYHELNLKDRVDLAYVYNPLENKYLDYKKDDSNSFNSYMNDYIVKNMLVSLWVYNSESEETFTFKSGQEIDQNEFEFVKLKKGWNFLSVFPTMIYNDKDKSDFGLKDMSGSCDIKSSYSFDASSNSWNELWDEEFNDNLMGYGFIVKVSEDCQLGLSEEISAPPAIPSN